jgi:predicted phage terminase large subunit-like protein
LDGGDPLELLNLLEEQDRRLSRGSFLAYYMRMTGFAPPKHVKLVCRLLQSMEEDKVDRAMVFMPPRAAKTTLCSHLFPSWLIGREPKVKIMSVAHTERYAKKIGGNVRKYLRLPQWPFHDVTISQDSSAKDAFTTPQGGEYNAFGMFGGNQHGNPAEWLFMDDIVKGRKIALSPHMREEAWETYKADLQSRLEGRAKQLLVFTRWHMDDPAGRILPENFDGQTGWYRDRETDERWFVLSIPAVAEHEKDPLGRKKGEWIWPGRIDERMRGGTRKRGGWIWSALYQQRPSPQEGLMFTHEHISRYDPAELDMTGLQIYGSSDYATKSEAGAPDPDYTVHMVWGVDSEFNIYLLDMWRGRTLSDEWVANFIRLVKKWNPLRWGEESGQIINSVGPFLTTIMQQESVFVNRVQLTSSVNKEQRAHSLLGMAQMGKFYLPKRSAIQPYFFEHLDAFEKELLQFPTGKHDDAVDAATLFARMLNRIISGKKPDRGNKSSPHGPTMDDLWSEHDAKMDRDKDW